MTLNSGIELKDALGMVGEGWGNLIRRAYNLKPHDTVITTVKEKFGGLRIYVDSAPREYNDALEHLCDESVQICEVCGKPGTQINLGGWWKTRCTDHLTM